MDAGFALVVNIKNFTNYLLESDVVPNVNILSMIFPVAGSTTVALVVFSGFH